MYFFEIQGSNQSMLNVHVVYLAVVSSTICRSSFTLHLVFKQTLFVVCVKFLLIRMSQVRWNLVIRFGLYIRLFLDFF